MRSVKTKFYVNKRYDDPVKINSSTDANRAVAQCVMYMQINTYGATAAEVYDESSGQLHAAIRRSVNGNITIEYKRNPQEYETRLAIGALFDK